MIRYRFIFAKKPDGSDNGFLKQIEYFKKFFTSNFELSNERKSKFSFGPALPFGYESESEYVDVIFKRREDDEMINFVISKNISYPYSLISFKTIPLHFPSVISVIDAIEYEVYLREAIIENRLNESIINRDLVHSVYLADNARILKLILKNNTGLKFLFDEIFIQKEIERVIRKKLYWKDTSGNLRII